MAIIVRTGTPGQNGAGASTVPGNIPAGSLPGEIAYACVRIRGGSPSSVSLTGWTPITGANHTSSSSIRQTVLARELDGTEGSSVNFVLDSSREAICTIITLGEVNKYNGNFGINGTPVGQVNSSSTSMSTGTGPSATAINCQLLFFGGVAGFVSDISPPAGMTERHELRQNTCAYDATELRTVGGGTGLRSTTISSAFTNIAQMFLVEPLVTPSAPSTLTGTPLSPILVKLDWLDTSLSEQGFRVERSTNSGGSWTPVATVGTGVVTVQVAQDPNSTAWYRVIAYNSQGDSTASNTAIVTTVALNPGITIPNYKMPEVLYKVVFRTTAGVKVAEFMDFLALSYQKRVNEPGVAAIVVNGDHRILSMLEDKMLVEVWRRVKGYTNWYIEFKAMFRDEESVIDDKGQETVTLLCPGAMHRLAWRHVDYQADVNLRSTFSALPAETIMKNIVLYNLGPNATTANGRVHSAVMGGKQGTVTTTTDQGRGTVMDWSCAHDNVLETLQQMAPKAGGDFDLLQNGANSWVFEFYPGQRGVNRLTTVKFSVERGNMRKPKVTIKRSSEKSFMIIGGPGEAPNRIIEADTGKNYNATDNHIEGWVDATQGKTAGARGAKAVDALDKAQSRRVLTFEIAQTLGTMYGVHYCIGGVLGDLVSATHRTIKEDHKIYGVSVTVSAERGEVLTILTKT